MEDFAIPRNGALHFLMKSVATPKRVSLQSGVNDCQSDAKYDKNDANQVDVFLLTGILFSANVPEGCHLEIITKAVEKFLQLLQKSTLCNYKEIAFSHLLV